MIQVSPSDAATSPGPWRPLRNATFRNLLASNLVSDIGTFMQTVGAAWLMTSLTSNPLYIALIQTATALPFFLLALPAGSVGDILDRRKLILGTETWMLGIAVALTVATLTGVMTPWLLLFLTLALSIGDAVESPSWRAIFPELVDKEELPAALALNGIEFNLARALGPGLGGFIVAAVGVGAAFAFNAFSFLGVIAVIARWKRPARKSTLPPETLPRSDLRRRPLRAVLPWHSYTAVSVSSSHFLHQLLLGALTNGSEGDKQESHHVWLFAWVLRIGRSSGRDRATTNPFKGLL
jgi:MFS family permease